MEQHRRSPPIARGNQQRPRSTQKSRPSLVWRLRICWLFKRLSTATVCEWVQYPTLLPAAGRLAPAVFDPKALYRAVGYRFTVRKRERNLDIPHPELLNEAERTVDGFEIVCPFRPCGPTIRGLKVLSGSDSVQNSFHAAKFRVLSANISNRLTIVIKSTSRSDRVTCWFSTARPTGNGGNGVRITHFA